MQCWLMQSGPSAILATADLARASLASGVLATVGTGSLGKALC